MSNYVTYHRNLFQNQKLKQEELTKKTLILLENIGKALRHKPTVKRAILFGSLIHGNFTVDSDIDIAIEGIPPDDFFNTWREIEDIVNMPVDLIDLKPKDTSIYNIVKITGKVIYEKS